MTPSAAAGVWMEETFSVWSVCSFCCWSSGCVIQMFHFGETDVAEFEPCLRRDRGGKPPRL